MQQHRYWASSPRSLSGAEATIVTLDNFTYDALGRLLAQTQCIGDASMGDACPTTTTTADLVLTGNVSTEQTATNSIVANPDATLLPGANLFIDQGDRELIAYHSYDELGQLKRKKVGGNAAAQADQSPGLQQVDHTYNVRGWLKTINADTENDNDLFDFTIRYNDPLSGTALYNGNISATAWATQSPVTGSNSISTSYAYTYDALNRIKTATDNTGHYDLQAIAYDKNGNITELERKGPTDTAATVFGLMDDLDYAYTGNQLQSVDDSASPTGFLDGNSGGTDYGYDANGNMTQDLNKGIAAGGISYNHLNLPTQVSLNSGTIDYIYDATGIKLKKIVSTGNTTDYAGNYVYENGVLQFFSQPEGYLEPKNANDYTQGFDYVYQYTDHLGNIRLSYKNTGTASNPNLEIQEENNYYPFGLEHKGYNNQINGVENNYQTFMGQEKEEELGKNTYAFQWRDYDPAIGRFNKIDRFAEKYESHSPYAFTKNNPIRFLEVAGDSLWISFGKDNANRVLYQNGELLNADGSRYEGKGVKVKKDGSIKITNSFLKSATKALGQIAQAEGETGTDVVSTLQSSENNFTIQRAGNRFGANQPGEKPNINLNDATYYQGQIEGKAYVGGGPPSNTIGTGGTIFWNPSDGGSYITQKGTRSANAAITLGHEMFHAYDANSGNLDGRMMQGGTQRLEARAVYFGNQLRSTATFGNRPLRYQYSKGGTILAPNGNPLNVAPPSIEVLKN